jgi:hypothetical protein
VRQKFFLATWDMDKVVSVKVSAPLFVHSHANVRVATPMDGLTKMRNDATAYALALHVASPGGHDRDEVSKSETTKTGHASQLENCLHIGPAKTGRRPPPPLSFSIPSNVKRFRLIGWCPLLSFDGNRSIRLVRDVIQ